jgi:flagellum-specific peptidoglycan hydrolase FlgJ
MPSYEKDRSVLENSAFRAYGSVDDYGKDYTNFLGHQRYQPVRGTNSVRDFAMALGKAGYHDDDDASYSNQLESIAKRVTPFLNPK